MSRAADTSQSSSQTTCRYDQGPRFHSESEIVTNMSAGYRIHSQVHLRQGQPASEDLLPQSHPGSSGRWKAGAYNARAYNKCSKKLSLSAETIRFRTESSLTCGQSRCTISAHARRESIGGGCAAFERHVTGADEGAPQQPGCCTAQVQLLPTSSTEV